MRAHPTIAVQGEHGACGPSFWTVIVEALFKLGIPKKTKEDSELDAWFDQLRAHGRELGVEIEPLTVYERICFEHDARWMTLS